MALQRGLQFESGCEQGSRARIGSEKTGHRACTYEKAIRHRPRTSDGTGRHGCMAAGTCWAAPTGTPHTHARLVLLLVLVTNLRCVRQRFKNEEGVDM